MDAHVCDYMGQIGNHLCYNDARPVEQAGHSAGAIRFFDQTYTQVGPDYGAEGDLRAPDIHELNTPAGQKGETFIQDIYEMKNMDLRQYDGPEDGYVLDGCFQEVNIRTKAVVFQWCALDWMPLYDTYMYLHGVNSINYSLPIGGNGQMLAPWDFFHINAIARNLEGDYAISARHLNTIFKIAGKDNVHGLEPGSIMWRLGGKHSDFKMDFNFSRQHTVRFHSTGTEESVLSLFDNAFDGWEKSSLWSSGKMFKVNNETMTASLITQYDDPDKQLSFSQGSLQLLDNGNVFIGWGNRHSFSEFTFDGQLLYHAEFTGDIETFRAWKHPWKGFPTYPAKVFGYAQNCSSPMYAYISWNGATEVQSWRLYSSWGTRHGPWHEVGTFEKTAFETFANISLTAKTPEYALYAPYMRADALGQDGEVLGTSGVAHTFVPKNDTVAWKFGCNETMCGEMYFRFEEQYSCGAGCTRSHLAAMYVMIIGICLVEVLTWCYHEMISRPSMTIRWHDTSWDWIVDESSEGTLHEKIQLSKQRGIHMNGCTGGTHKEKSSRLNSGTDHDHTAESNQQPGIRVGEGFRNLMTLVGVVPSDSERETHERRRSRSITNQNQSPQTPKRSASGRIKASGTDRDVCSPT